MSETFLDSPSEIIDYQFLMDRLKGYKQPRLKLASLLKRGDLIRIKKGLYVIAPTHFHGLYSREILANVIYGPSYLSLEYALAYYGLIPEKVEIVTSITCNRYKNFNTPLGSFIYYYLHPDKYSMGVTYRKLDERRGFLIATKEKALCDCVARQPHLHNQEDIEHYLFGLRLEVKDLMKFSIKKISEIAKIYQNHQVNLLKTIILKYARSQ